jgi:hypothetical protein
MTKYPIPTSEWYMYISIVCLCIGAGECGEWMRCLYAEAHFVSKQIACETIKCLHGSGARLIPRLCSGVAYISVGVLSCRHSAFA